MAAINKKQRKYLRKLYQWIILAALLPLLLFAFIAYVNVEKAVVNNEYQANKKILYEIEYNINFMDDMIANAILSMYYNPEISPLILNPDNDFTDMINEINKIKTSIIGSNPFIHSIYLYNGSTKTYYTTESDLFFKDYNFESLLQSKQLLPKLKPLPRTIEYSLNNKKHDEHVVSYLMYEYKNEFNQPEGALVVNASTEWLLNNIKNINMTDNKQQDTMIVLDDKDQIVENNAESNSLQKAVQESYNQNYDEKNSIDKTGYYQSYINGKKYLVTYAYVDKMNWTLVNAQLYDQVFERINILKYSLLAMIVLIMLLAFIASILISRSIYRPIDNLVNNVISQVPGIDHSHAKDEISYLNNAYQFSMEQLNEYKLKKQSDREILKTYFLRKLLVDSRSVTHNEFVKAVSELGIGLSMDKPGVVCIVKIDNRAQFNQAFNTFDRGLCIYGMINISSEILSDHFHVEVVDINDDHLAFILNIEDLSLDTTNKQLTKLWEQTQSYIHQYFKVSTSVFISDLYLNMQNLTVTYEAALNNSVYRYIFGRSCVLTYSRVQPNLDNTHVGYSAALEKKMIESLKSGNISSVKETLRHLFDEISKLNYNNALLSVMSLVNTLMQVTDEMSRIKLEPLQINFNLLSQQIFSMETMQEQSDALLQICEKIAIKTGGVENHKNAIITNTVIELIQADYSNPALCLQYIADKLNLSAKHVSKLFNQHYERSVADYINDVRLEKAAESFRTSNGSVKEILQKIGMENDSYFYRLFKKKFGVTPKEYLLIHHVQGTRQMH